MTKKEKSHEVRNSSNSDLFQRLATFGWLSYWGNGGDYGPSDL
jgi:hypothetical protein